MESLTLKRYTDDVAKRLAAKRMTIDDVGVLLEIIREYDRAIIAVMDLADAIAPDEPWTGDVAEGMYKQCVCSRIRVEELAINELGEEYGTFDN